MLKTLRMTVRHKSGTSKGSLFEHQDRLPSLPVPPLSKTLERYKRSIQPYYVRGASDPEYLRYCSVIDDFAKTQGPKLQQKLEQFASDKRNWLSHWWDDYAYLTYRDPVSPFVSYFFHHKELNSKIGKDQVTKAACLASKALDFMEAIEKETLEPELIKNNPFCMESFKWMFNNCRVPEPDRDANPRFSPEQNRYMIVIANNRFYKLLHHVDGERVGLADLAANIQAIRTHSDTLPPVKNAVGALTSTNRDVWATNYAELAKSPVNKQSLRAIQASSFVLCLDDDYPTTIEQQSRNAWHGNGTNRWFDKPVQFFVSRNGTSGFLGEHSKMDGTPTLRMNDWLVRELEKMQPPEDTYSTPLFRELQFDVSPKTQTAIEDAKASFDKTVNALDLRVWQFHGLGKSHIKLFKASPDAFIQMLIQLAYYKYTGTVRPTYESASTRKYFAGRTETCRSVSNESLHFVRTWEDVSATKEQKIAAFRNAASAHVEYITAASDGRGVDRHLFGLAQMCEEEKHDFFKDPIFAYSSYWYLSTSQLSSEQFNGYGWAPVVPEGLGLAYMVNNDWLHVNVTVFKNNQLGLEADKMVYYLGLAARELKEALASENLKAKL
ncbi:hypothetical protein KL906_001504 [Ogataea polymorpha]|uniref:Carnitine O-acetyltransferase, mitochondrial n=2 Tax=Ogataea polymorpha TaxID=460523 RepID=A0A9P8TGC8_9ASCO|nr:hypothetical protein KL937_001467 [Ogataea polymorpha]KAG7894135.1 hypothetical protein KL908_002412 [Ogataea polymorpha]KAG7911124.1 hypothetical protein KL906_001504 [Ogataea polymorpha]KAG7918330.1 hypothetical protein KL927_001787 [Ogataea polymorpha]KAG7931637.1 hypothetical protein KL934_004049 [Ogataea polymorpha]